MSDRSNRKVIDFYESDTDSEPEYNDINDTIIITPQFAIKNQRLVFKRKHPEHNECPICMDDIYSKSCCLYTMWTLYL